MAATLSRFKVSDTNAQSAKILIFVKTVKQEISILNTHLLKLEIPPKHQSLCTHLTSKFYPGQEAFFSKLIHRVNVNFLLNNLSQTLKSLELTSYQNHLRMELNLPLEQPSLKHGL